MSEQIPEKSVSNNKKLNITLITIAVLVVLFIASIPIFTLLMIKQNSENSLSFGRSSESQTTLDANQPLLVKSDNQKTDSAKIQTAGLFSGKFKKSTQNLGLFSDSSSAEPREYYETGVYTRGKYKDYTRILTIDMGIGISPLFFITKDFKEFIFVDDGETSYVSTSDRTKLMPDLFDKKVVKADVVEDELPKYITLNDKFSLVKSGPVERSSIDLATYNANPDSYSSDLSQLKEIKNITKTNLKIYEKPVIESYQDPQVKITDPVTPTSDYKQRFSTSESSSSVIIPDSTGLPYLYNISYNSDIAKRPQAEAEYKKSLDNYNKDADKRTELEKKLREKNPDPNYNAYDEITKQLGPSAEYPNIDKLDLSLKSVDFTKTTKTDYTNFFKTYSRAFPGACAFDLTPNVTTEVNENDLQEAAQKDGISIYKLKDKNSELYKLTYQKKVASPDSELGPDGINGIDAFTLNNPKVKKPTYDQYVANNPLLFIKDPWNRIVILGEFDYMLGGGCGKPVMYFYPQVDTKVNIKMPENLTFSTDIPKYNKALGWNILAKPNGNFEDLQAQYTDCNQFESAHVGSEYAQKACKQNNYPYIYWSGNIAGSKDYPKMTTGWIVQKADLDNFLSQKLDQVGLTTREKNDMMEYWVPYLASKKGEYFRISFLQTNDLNKLIPVDISPKPDTLQRIFLDWDNFEQKPSTQIMPQKLEAFDRNGFVVLEWGGLKK